MMNFADFVVLRDININSIDGIMDAKEEYNRFELLSWCAEKAMKYNDMARHEGLEISEDETMYHAERVEYYNDYDYEVYHTYFVEGWKWTETTCDFVEINHEYTFPSDEHIGSILIEDPYVVYFTNETTGESNMLGTCHGWDEEELEYEHRCDEEEFEYEDWCEEKAEYYNKIEGLIEWGNHAYAEEFYDEISWVCKTLERYDKIEGLKTWAKSINCENIDNEKTEDLINDPHASEMYDAYDVIHDSIEDGSIYDIENVETILSALLKFGEIDLRRSDDIKLDDFSLTVYDVVSLWHFVAYRYSFLTNKWDVKLDEMGMCSFDFQVPTYTVYKDIINIILKHIKAFN